MKSVALIGGGSSVAEGVKTGLWEKLKTSNIDLFSINFAFMAMPYLPTKQVWIDTTFFRNNLDALEKLQKQGVECITKKHAMYNAIATITTYDVTREQFNTDITKPLYIGQMGLSGTFALSVALARGYDNIYLLGYDFGTTSMSNQFTHFYQNDGLQIKSHGINNPGVYRTHNDAVKKDVKVFEQFSNLPITILNVSPNSNIPYFPKITYPQLYEELYNIVVN